MIRQPEECILRSLRKISRAIDMFSHRLAKQYLLTVPQLICLRSIRERGAISPSEIASEISLSQATVTGILKRLEMRGLITRTRSERDRRRMEISLTPSGLERLTEAPSPLHERLANRLQALPHADREQIAESLERIVELMEAEEICAAPILGTGGPTAETTLIREVAIPAESIMSPEDSETASMPNEDDRRKAEIE